MAWGHGEVGGGGGKGREEGVARGGGMGGTGGGGCGHGVGGGFSLVREEGWHFGRGRGLANGVWEGVSACAVGRCGTFCWY